jgi:hypothetical protein
MVLLCFCQTHYQSKHALISYASNQALSFQIGTANCHIKPINLVKPVSRSIMFSYNSYFIISHGTQLRNLIISLHRLFIDISTDDIWCSRREPLLEMVRILRTTNNEQVDNLL